MALLLANLAVVVVNALNLQIVALNEVLHLLVLLPVQYSRHLLHSPFQLLVLVCHDYDVKGLVVLKNVLLLAVGAPAPH